MIPSKSRRLKGIKLSKNIDRLYRENNCRECSVMVTRMDFARILGKFTKVKIQYESSKSPKRKQTPQNIKTRFKKNENGVIHDNIVREKSKTSKLSVSFSPKVTDNVLKENNRLKNLQIKEKDSNHNNKISHKLNKKLYHVVFTDPNINNKNDTKPSATLTELLSKIDESVLPSPEWSIDYFPKMEEIKDDKVYDRIAAELEDIMNNGKTLKAEDKPDEFPSIMDILNDNSATKSGDQSITVEVKSNLESSDVEAMLLGEPNSSHEPVQTSEMEVDNTDVATLIKDVDQLNALASDENTSNNATDKDVTNDISMDNPHSPSILDEALQKGIEEHLPPTSQADTTATNIQNEGTTEIKKPVEEVSTKSNNLTNDNENPKKIATVQNGQDIYNILSSKASCISEVMFKKSKNGECYKSVTCQKNLMYIVEINGKAVEFLGAPKFVSDLKDIQILLQIVNDTELKSFHVLQ